MDSNRFLADFKKNNNEALDQKSTVPVSGTSLTVQTQTKSFSVVFNRMRNNTCGTDYWWDLVLTSSTGRPFLSNVFQGGTSFNGGRVLEIRRYYMQGGVVKYRITPLSRKASDMDIIYNGGSMDGSFTVNYSLRINTTDDVNISFTRKNLGAS